MWKRCIALSSKQFLACCMILLFTASCAEKSKVRERYKPIEIDGVLSTPVFKKCSSCDGRGFHVSRCTRCNGEGERTDPCYGCGGQGDRSFALVPCSHPHPMNPYMRAHQADTIPLLPGQPVPPGGNVITQPCEACGRAGVIRVNCPVSEKTDCKPCYGDGEEFDRYVPVFTQ